MALGASDAARLQAYQTRMRIGRALYLRIFFSVIIAWLTLTFYVVWHETGAYFPRLAHQFFWRWALLSTMVRMPFIGTITLRCTAPANGRWYPVGPLVGWMNGPHMYYQSFPTWFLHYGLRTALIPISLGCFTLLWRARRAVDAEHLRGLRLLPHRQHAQQLHGGWIKRAYRTASGEQPGIKIGEVTLPQKKEFEHILIVGQTGSGKTILNRHLLYQLQDRREPVVIYDPDGEAIAEFYDPNRGDLVLNPVDRRCPFFSPFGEIRDEFRPIDAAALAASIVRGRPINDTQEYFARNARALVRGMFEAIPAKDRDDLEVFADFLKQTRDEIRTQLEHTSAPAAVIDPGAHDSGGGQGIIGVVDTAIEGFSYLPRRDQTDRTWSPRAYAANPRGWLFLTSESTTKAAVESIQGIWLDCLVRWLFNRPIGSPHVWVFAEEAPAMGYQAQIKELAVRGRKRHLSLVMTVQSISQLREIWGHDGAVTLIGAPSTKVIFRIDETEMAEWASTLLGEREIERLTMTSLSGVSSYREGINLQPQRSLERIVLPDEIKALPDLSAYLCVAGHDRTRISIEPRYLNKRQPDFLPRSYSSGKRQTGWSAL
jgi:Type IV secretion-system coupling protein DNA-binding domain